VVSRNLGCWLLAVAALATAAPAQEPEGPPVIEPATNAPAVSDGGTTSLLTPDGSRFLLVPTGGSPVVHWAMLTPAGASEDPPGLEGLSFAVARASMLGTSAGQSRDAIAEPDVLAIQDRFEQAWAGLLASGEVGTKEQLQKVLEARAAAAGLADRTAWMRGLMQAPATNVALTELPDAVILRITCSVSGLLNVGQAIIDRRDGRILRDLHNQFRTVRAEVANARDLGPRAAMRREVLGLSFLGHPLARSFAAAREPRALARGQAIGVYHNTQHPTRTLHVLTGGFDPNAVAAMLSKLFGRSTWQDPTPAVPAPEATSLSARESVIPGGDAPAVTIGFRLPEGFDRDTLSVLMWWLAGDRDSELAQRLREKGHPEAVVRATAPFLGASGMLALLEFHDPAETAKASSKKFLANVEACLDEVMAQAPNDRVIQRAISHLQTERASTRIGAAQLAEHVAIACGIEGRHPSTVLGNRDLTVTGEAVKALSQSLFAPARRAIVRLEVTP